MRTLEAEGQLGSSAEAVSSTNEPSTIADALEGVTAVVVAIHGIGSQRRGDTVRYVATRFAAALEPSRPSLPLGFFRLDRNTEVHVSRLPRVDSSQDEPGEPEESALRKIGFAEVYWADVPRGAVKDEDTLEETKSWAKSVVSRAHAMYKRVQGGRISEEDFYLGAGVIEEIIETIAVLENLLLVTDKAGIFKFDIGPLLRDYLGDVQIVTEFVAYRARIVGRFHRMMRDILRAVPRNGANAPDIYVVAHSEGTVVSFLAMLQALTEKKVFCPDEDAAKSEMVSTDWINHVRGYMTLGSPIDKHLALWNGLWTGVEEKLKSGDGIKTLEQKICWRNYYDHGDPIGFELDGARDFLAEAKCEAFEFEDKHDFGFSRAWVPGKAHNDYWNDKEVFEHFLYDVIAKRHALHERKSGETATPMKPVEPTNKWFRGSVSTAIPYVASALLHFVAVFVLIKAVAFAGGTGSRAEIASVTAPLTLLLIGITVAARVPRLVARSAKSVYWPLLAMGVFGCCAASYARWMPQDFKNEVLAGLSWMIARDAAALAREVLPLALAALVASTGWLVPRRPRWARRFLLGSGVLLIGAIVVSRLVHAQIEVPVWPVILAGFAFLYLWWLAILLFDLAFVWHRYIRYSVGLEALRAWKSGKEMKGAKLWGPPSPSPRS